LNAIKQTTTHSWFEDLIGRRLPVDGGSLEVDERSFVYAGGILRSLQAISANQRQTSDTFGFKWHQRESYESPTVLSAIREWLLERYGSPQEMSWLFAADRPQILLDAGCGSGLAALELFGLHLNGVRYIGADISTAVDVAAERCAKLGVMGSFIQCDLMALPFAPQSIDAIFSEGVLHHTDSTCNALLCLARLLRIGGRFMFYVYNRKGPIREFTDDFIRDRLQSMSPDEAWRALAPLTKFGAALGELGIEIDVPEEISLLGIPAGRIDLQRFFYWNIFKAYYRPGWSPDEMNHVNFDWYAPKNAHRQTPAEVRAWCSHAGLAIEREIIEPAGISVIARKTEQA
jgi:arsenite methyltransferase